MCITLRFHYHEICKVLCRTDESPLSVVNVGNWMRWSSSSLLRQMAEVCVGSDTEVLLGIWVKITLFSSSRKTSIRSSPQPVPSLIEKLGGNMKEFKLEFLHVKRNRDIKMARSLDSDHPSLSKRQANNCLIQFYKRSESSLTDLTVNFSSGLMRVH